jgi:hypothetical protein
VIPLSAACPHCLAAARLEYGSLLRWRCGVCGGPVVPADGHLARSHGELANLVAAQRAHGMALGWTGAAVTLWALAVTATALAALLALASWLTASVLAAVAAIAGLVAAYAMRRAKNKRADARARLDEAWEQVAGELLGARGDQMTADDVARTMHTERDHAEGLLARLSARGNVRVVVRDDADLGYGADGPSVQEVGRRESER